MNDQNNINNQNPTNPLDQSQIAENSKPIEEVVNINTQTVPSISQEEKPIENESPSTENQGFLQMDSSTPPPPPIPTIEGIPNEEQGTNSPNLDIPTVISTDNKPKKKFGGKIIATILGVLLLVLGIGAGVVLLRQQQEIRTKAGACCGPSDYMSCTSPYVCTNTGVSGCDGGMECILTGGSNFECTTNANCLSGFECADNKCQPIGRCTRNEDCNSGFTCVNWDCVETSTCPSGTLKEHAGDFGHCGWPVCGPGDETICMNGCTCPQGCTCTGPEYPGTAGGTFASKICECGGGITPTIPPSNPTNPPSNPTNPPSSPTASCINIKAYDANWNVLTAAELAELNPGDTVRFTVAGTATSGTFSKAKFKINTVTQPETTAKKPNTQEFYVEYVIPENIESFTINAQIYHSTQGWI